MTTLGFTRSTMKDESRVALLPKDLEKIVETSSLFFQEGYAAQLGVLSIEDREYEESGGIIVPRERLAESDVLIIPKRSKEDETLFRKHQVLIGWLYVDQSPWLREALQKKEMTAIAFEKMYSKEGYLFSENRIIAGRAGMLQALSAAGRPPEDFKRVAVLGRGQVAKGVFRTLESFGLKYEVFHTRNYKTFFGNLESYDMIVSCIKWDHTQGDFMTREHIRRMKKGSYLVDITSEGISGSKPQPLNQPAYIYTDQSGHSILVYNNEHTPTLWPLKASEGISKALVPLINSLLEGRSNEVIEKAKVMDKGRLVRY